MQRSDPNQRNTSGEFGPIIDPEITDRSSAIIYYSKASENDTKWAPNSGKHHQPGTRCTPRPRISSWLTTTLPRRITARPSSGPVISQAAILLQLVVCQEVFSDRWRVCVFRGSAVRTPPLVTSTTQALYLQLFERRMPPLIQSICSLLSAYCRS